MTDIYQKIQERTKNWNVNAIVQAVIEDDPEMAEHAEDLKDTITQMKNGNYSNWRATQISLSPIEKPSANI